MSRDTKLYDLLGVSPDADDSKIRSAYRKLAHKLHPDRNRAPDAKEQFQNVQRAYDILSDEHKRQLYDQFGEEGVERGGPPGMDGMGGMGMGGLFEQLFSQGGGRQRPSGPRRGRDVAHALPVSLEDLYRGKTSKLALKKSVLCGTCRGSGARAGAAEQTCASCRGQGVRVQVRQLGPMIQQVQMPCGEILAPGTVKVIPEEGFPTEAHASPGDLYIKFNVQFPTAADMTPEKFALLEQALPPRPPLPRLEGEIEEVVLADPDPNARAGASANGRRPGATHEDGDDDDDPRGPPGVQCATQ
ncbi:hypothetical protein AMAG_11407 [Allomyces macrogynus ATCC 38327]|uniref:J domain-containing protein n=1 Tax=Allomyces macrogynus (strain ATCC 38327) TaxID=578462 RepID=A0A0L0SWP4_ALLM3|nr:hypothetical protein AMAG_11407 [Allomyces macrogynus ATCC 38327]|eukprot:KNE66932.1 hypothetical protein AMAG_11407 [Allomyces macrogynus ATCC 38327]